MLIKLLLFDENLKCARPPCFPQNHTECGRKIESKKTVVKIAAASYN